MRLSLIAVSLIVLSGVLVGCNAASSSQNRDDDSSGGSASWASQIGTALSAAQKVDSAAVPLKVVAEPKGDLNQGGNYETLQVRFFFLQPSGSPITSTFDAPTPELTWPEMVVSLEDTSPTSTLRVDPNFEYVNRSLSAQDREQILTSLKEVQISPAQALQKTIDFGRNFSKQRNTDVMPLIRLVLGKNVPARFSTPALWNVIYITRDKDLVFSIDARTGQVLEQTEQ